MATKIKKWLIRISERTETITENAAAFFAVIAVISFIAIQILSKIASKSEGLDLIYTITAVIMIVSAVMSILFLDLIATFLRVVNKNKDIILSNNFFVVLLSNEYIVMHIYGYIIFPLLIILDAVLLNKVQFNFIAMIILAIISLIFLFKTIMPFSKKISNYFKKKLS